MPEKRGAAAYFCLRAHKLLQGVSVLGYDQTQKSAPKTHAVSMENRARLSLTGVVDVSGFDESIIVLATGLGPLTVRGESLHIDRIDLDAGQLEVRGKIRELSYEDAAPEGGFWSRLFG